MSTAESTEDRARPEATPRAPDRAQYWVCAVLAAIGALVVYDAATLDGSFAASNDPIGPRPVPIILGAALIVLAAVYAIDTARGGRGASEDADHESGFDWRTLGLLCAVFIANALLIDWLGWAISGSLLFYGAAIVLGSRRYFWALVAAVALSLATFYGFAIGLGVALPAGILQGIL